MNILKKALFLDRDGVINHRIIDDYVASPSQLVVFDFAAEAIQTLKLAFDYIFIVTNQQGIGKKLMSENDLSLIHEKMLEVIDPSRSLIDKIYFCPHLKNENCLCRKPAIGMALMAKNDFPDINFAESFLVGDSESDISFALSAGMQGIAVGGLADTRAKYILPNLMAVAKLENL